MASARSQIKRGACPAQEATTCKSFSAIAHAVLPSSAPMADTDSWGGPLYGMIGEDYLGLKAALSGNDGAETWYEDGTGCWKRWNLYRLHRPPGLSG